MSTNQVREAFYAALEEFSETVRTDASFVKTISEANVPDDSLWFTAAFSPFDTEPLFCDRAVLHGTVEVSAFGNGGIGDFDVVQLADDIAEFFNENPILQDNVSVSRVGQPVESTAGDGVAWYGVIVAIDYICST